eukprot:760008-Hanusia_phi.AAC.1
MSSSLDDMAKALCEPTGENALDSPSCQETPTPFSAFCQPLCMEKLICANPKSATESNVQLYTADTKEYMQITRDCLGRSTQSVDLTAIVQRQLGRMNSFNARMDWKLLAPALSKVKAKHFIIFIAVVLWQLQEDDSAALQASKQAEKCVLFIQKAWQNQQYHSSVGL